MPALNPQGKETEPPEGTVVHYGWDFNAYPHLKSTFNKFKYNDIVPWSDHEQFKQEIDNTPFNWVKLMLQDIISLRNIDIDRQVSRDVAIPVV